MGKGRYLGKEHITLGDGFVAMCDVRYHYDEDSFEIIYDGKCVGRSALREDAIRQAFGRLLETYPQGMPISHGWLVRDTAWNGEVVVTEVDYYYHAENGLYYRISGSDEVGFHRHGKLSKGEFTVMADCEKPPAHLSQLLVKLKALRETAERVRRSRLKTEKAVSLQIQVAFNEGELVVGDNADIPKRVLEAIQRNDLSTQT